MTPSRDWIGDVGVADGEQLERGSDRARRHGSARQSVTTATVTGFSGLQRSSRITTCQRPGIEWAYRDAQRRPGITPARVVGSVSASDGGAGGSSIGTASRPSIR